MSRGQLHTLEFPVQQDAGVIRVEGYTKAYRTTLAVDDLGGSTPLAAGWVLLLATSSGGASADGFAPSDYTYNDGGVVPSRWR